MPKKVSIPYHLSASGGAEADVTLYTVPDGYQLKIKEWNIFFPAGVYGELEIYFKHGNMKVAPSTGVYKGDNLLMPDDLEATYESGAKVVMHYKNTNATETRDAFILLKGVEE